MASITAPQRSQSLAALDRANTARLGAAALKADLKAGRLGLGDALADERAGCVTVFDLLRCQRRWGPDRARRLLTDLRISENRRVARLTDRQRRLIASTAAKS